MDCNTANNTTNIAISNSTYIVFIVVNITIIDFVNLN